ncbi:hypothetical protein ASPZODRAFT_148016 [Penicilliopsis zonata CBS 506.65]|uniref:USP domain-containing protein n=1 Tax=Penicilliopsis zonata CBS 506.65 TaxID=1073090 RepID=A0A1L9STS5_9EURO|nr:hypothetical protein ASPZODRAFT_148016 [Penicilliopsis zonata CBS 506.65]OJJ50521.1 hypothetical protein ASPZODRAFT_148016 [Penicilliopsis zonata CBS 506.65]
MAAAPLESSNSTPLPPPLPAALSSPESSREQQNSGLMEGEPDDIPPTTRKRPRLDSGSAVCESLSAHEAASASSAAAEHKKHEHVQEQEKEHEPEQEPVEEAASKLNRPASRVAIISMKKSPEPPSSPMATEPTEPAEFEPLPEQEGPIPMSTPASSEGHQEACIEESFADPSAAAATAAASANAISISSSPSQSPEIEVAEVEDMDQDPAESNWRILGAADTDPDAMGDRPTPQEVVQIHDPVPLAENFPRLHGNRDMRENMEEIGALIEKGHAHDAAVFMAVKNWLDDVINILDQLTYDTFIEDRDFWEDLPGIIECLLRRTQDLQFSDGRSSIPVLEEFFVAFARLAMYLVHLDTVLFTHLAEEPDLPAPDFMSKTYLSALGWILQIGNIPFTRSLERLYGAEIANMVARVNDLISDGPIDALHHLAAFAASIVSLLPRWPQLSSALISVLTIAHNLVESGSERRKFGADQELLDSPTHAHMLKEAYTLFRAADEKYQMHINKKSPWITSEATESIFRFISFAYLSIAHQDADLCRQLALDLDIRFPDDTPFDEMPQVMFSAWKFNVLKKHFMEGRMELRVYGVETMQSELVGVWRQYIHTSPTGVDHPIVRYLVNFLKENKIVEYIVGVDSHPQLISRSGNIVGFLVVTSTYTDLDTDIIWQTVTDSQDPRTVSEVLSMLTKTFPMHLPSSPALLYLCSKLLALPLNRFDARVIEFCEQLMHQVREKHTERLRLEPYDALHGTSLHVDAIPLRLCVRLIRESTADPQFPVEQKTLVQQFASAQLTQFIRAGLSEEDKLEMYERCIQDIAEMNSFTVGSIQALNAMLPVNDPQEIQKLAVDFDLTRLIVLEITHTLNTQQIDFTDPFSRTGFLSRVQMLSRIIDKAPDTITPELSDMIWSQIFMSKALVTQGRTALWDMLCSVTNRSMKRNPFLERCIHEYLGQVAPVDYSFEVLAFAKQTITYEVRFDPPPFAVDDEVVSIPGMDRIWNLILTAPPGSIETEATSFAIDIYLDHQLIRRSSRASVEVTHIALVDRCVDQLKSAATKLKAFNDTSADSDDTSMTVVPLDGGEVGAEELRFSRALLFLRQLLQGLRARPQYSPPQGPPPQLPTRPEKGNLIDIPYQAFSGGTQSKVRTLSIGDLSTAMELVDRLKQLTGFSKFDTIYGGQKIDLQETPQATLRDMKIRSGLLILRKTADAHETPVAGRRQSLNPVDSEVLKHFDDLYDLLNLEDHLAREIYDFLVVFPPQDRVRDLVKSNDKTEKDIFPLEHPYNLLYSVHALSICLREAAPETMPNEGFVSHSIQVLVSCLTHPQISESLEESHIKLLVACNLVECLLLAFLVRPPVSVDQGIVSDPTPLVQRLLTFIETGRRLSVTSPSATGTQKLICNSFAILVEGSVRDNTFWRTVKQNTQLDDLIFMLLLDEPNWAIRKEIAENIAMICGPSNLGKKSGKVQDEDVQNSAVVDNPTRIDILAAIWEAFVGTFPKTSGYAPQSREFFEVALSVFRSVAEKSPGDIIFGEYLKTWSGIMLSHRTEEFVGREPVDYLVLGFARLLRLCMDLADSTTMPVDTLDLVENLFNYYLFPDLSLATSEPISPQIPVMHTQTRQELYNILILLCKRDENFSKIIELLEDIIPQDYTYSLTWCFDRYKMIRSPEGYAGLKNLSNTCYLNSLLAQLFMNVRFREFMLSLQAECPTSSQLLLEETKKVFGNMQETWLKSVDPQGLVDTIRTYDNEPIDVTVQMDVDEFYNLLFDRWEAQISDAEMKKKFRSFYGGQLVQQIKSKECPHISERLEPFSAIQCEIKGKASLEESLQAYVEGEIMQGDNKYSCTSCGRHVDAVKRACLKDIPDNLIFHLKRFDFDMVTMMRSKINDEFQFPDRIDMRPFTVEYLSDPTSDLPQDVFELVGVLVHSGTAESGHYYSYIRERPTADGRGSWVEFNDSDVSRFDPSKIADQCFGGSNDPLQSAAMGQMRYHKVWSAYMLFYQRVSSMETAKEPNGPIPNSIPVRVPLPVELRNHIAMENEVFIRAYCLLDPHHAFFVRYLLSRARDVIKSGDLSTGKSAVFVALDTLEQLISRTREPMELDNLATELLRTVNESPQGACRVLEWVTDKPDGIRNLALKSPHAAVKTSFSRIVVSALARLQKAEQSSVIGEAEQEEWRVRFMNAFESIVVKLESLWPILHTVSRSWDDYFDLLLLLCDFGIQEAGVILDSGFLVKVLEIIWLDREDAKKLKRHYLAYYKLVERGRRFSYRKMMDFLISLLGNIDLTLPVTARYGTPRTLQDGKYSLNEAEDALIRPLGRNRELVFLKKVVQQQSNPPACRAIVSWLLNWEPDSDLTDPICKALEEGLRVAPASLCTPFLEGTLVFCRRSPDELRIVEMIDFVAKGVESINNSGGKEHLTFFTSLMASHNERIGRDERWFSTQAMEKVPDWAPTLLIYPEKTLRATTFEILRDVLFGREYQDSTEDWPAKQASIARELARTCVDRLQKTYLVNPGQNIEARVVETINIVLTHCLDTYFDKESEEDQDFVRQAQAITAAIDELSVDLPEDLVSESDFPSPEEWEDNSLMASDSEIGLAGSP